MKEVCVLAKKNKTLFCWCVLSPPPFPFCATQTNPFGKKKSGSVRWSQAEKNRQNKSISLPTHPTLTHTHSQPHTPRCTRRTRREQPPPSPPPTPPRLLPQPPPRRRSGRARPRPRCLHSHTRPAPAWRRVGRPHPRLQPLLQRPRPPRGGGGMNHRLSTLPPQQPRPQTPVPPPLGRGGASAQ